MPETIANSTPSSRALGRLHRDMLARPFVWGLGLLALVSLVFFLVPGLDLAVTRLFYDPEARFPGRESALLENMRNAGLVAEWAFGIAVIAPLAMKLALPHARLLVKPRATLFALATLAVGPGIIVNGILKTFWGRARPNALREFGGDATFSPVWWVSDQCERNCSFVSGEAASAFWLVALVFLVRKERRPAVAAATLAFAATVSLTRIAVGAHFLSDVLIAWLMTLCVMIALARLLLTRLSPAFDVAVEAIVERAGQRLRGVFRRG
jgi:lipid A 4'-phosphatase